MPRYGANPEQKVSVGMSVASLNELMLMTELHYQAWLTNWYSAYKAPSRSGGKGDGKGHGMDSGMDFGKNYADDTQMFR